MATKDNRKGAGIFEVAVAGGKTAKEAAVLAGISETTAGRRMKDPAVQARIRELRADMVRQTAGALSEAMVEAVAKLRALLGAENEQVQLSAARSLLEFGMRIKETVEVEDRLQALEASAGLEPVPGDESDEAA